MCARLVSCYLGWVGGRKGGIGALFKSSVIAVCGRLYLYRVQATLYRCRKCRRLLASSQHVVDVREGGGQAAFPFRKRDSAPKAGDVADAGCVFVQPLRWMQGLYQLSGKLYCPRRVHVLVFFVPAGLPGLWYVSASKRGLAGRSTAIGT